MRIGVVGGGIFGTTAAWMLAKKGHEVFLFERENDLLQAASGINQYRLHQGFHYPRSKETMTLTREGNKSFMREYGDAVVTDPVEHWYALAKEGGYSTPEHCLSTWGECGLAYEHASCDLINQERIAHAVKVTEDLMDPKKLRELAWKKLKEHGVRVLLNTQAEPDDLASYDQVVVATYAHNNKFLEHLPKAQKSYQFELCEKAVLKLPQKFQGKGIVVIDGPFMCIDPMGSTGYHVMGNVVHAIHAKNIGKFPIVPEEFQPLLNRGVIQNPPITNIKKLLAHAAEYLPGVEHARHIGSMYTFRTVPPHREHDDARPTTVERVDTKHLTIFSGKIPTCVDAAEQVLNIIES